MSAVVPAIMPTVMVDCSMHYWGSVWHACGSGYPRDVAGLSGSGRHKPWPGRVRSADVPVARGAGEAHRRAQGYLRSPAGVPELRAAVARKIERSYGISYDPQSEVAITSGATGGFLAPRCSPSAILATRVILSCCTTATTSIRSSRSIKAGSRSG